MGASVVAHAALLATLLRLGAGAAARDADSVVVELTPELPSFAPLPSALAAAQELPDPPLPTQDEAVVKPPSNAADGDRNNAIARTIAPREGDGRAQAPPAADQGLDGGHRPAAATRRDRSTLQSKVADTATAVQASRLETSRRSSSPQAIRREVRTGVGDSVRTRQATRAPSAAQADSPPALTPVPDAPGAPSGTRAAHVQPDLSLSRASDAPSSARGVGPLAAEAGDRMFDTELRGRAADNQTRRAASSEAHPGITDFSHAGVAAPTDSLQGRGPGSAPGAVARATNGVAPVVYGARDPQELGAAVAERTRERQYDRYRQEIQRRIQNVLMFPKMLALRLEQGEAVVTFVVRPDGWLGEGPRVVKSSGFQEFDTEAVKAVLRAAPFPRRPEAAGLQFSLPVTFENPLVH